MLCDYNIYVYCIVYWNSVANYNKNIKEYLLTLIVTRIEKNILLCLQEYNKNIFFQINTNQNENIQHPAQTTNAPSKRTKHEHPDPINPITAQYESQ